MSRISDDEIASVVNFFGEILDSNPNFDGWGRKFSELLLDSGDDEVRTRHAVEQLIQELPIALRDNVAKLICSRASTETACVAGELRRDELAEAAQTILSHDQLTLKSIDLFGYQQIVSPIEESVKKVKRKVLSGIKSRILNEDLITQLGVNEYLLFVYSKIDKFGEDPNKVASFGGWVYTVIHNRTIDILRSAQRQQDIESNQPSIAGQFAAPQLFYPMSDSDWQLFRTWPHKTQLLLAYHPSSFVQFAIPREKLDEWNSWLRIQDWRDHDSFLTNVASHERSGILQTILNWEPNTFAVNWYRQQHRQVHLDVFWNRLAAAGSNEYCSWTHHQISEIIKIEIDQRIPVLGLVPNWHRAPNRTRFYEIIQNQRESFAFPWLGLTKESPYEVRLKRLASVLDKPENELHAAFTSAYSGPHLHERRELLEHY